MPEVQEVFRMATQKVRPDPGALERQHRNQQRRVARQKTAVFVLAGALVIGGAVFGMTTLRDDAGDTRNSPAGGATSPIPLLPSGSVEPGRYVVAYREPGLADSYRISIQVPGGYAGYGDLFVLKRSSSTEAAVGTMTISEIFGDACHWRGTALGRSAVSSGDAAAAALASQQGLRVSTPTDVTVDGFAGTYMERRVPAQTRISDCDGEAKTPELPQFTVYRSPGFDNRVLHPGQLQQLWILDLDGVPLVIEATSDAETSAQVRAELVQMVESVRIDPR
jgi:hypothetical protein